MLANRRESPVRAGLSKRTRHPVRRETRANAAPPPHPLMEKGLIYA